MLGQRPNGAFFGTLKYERVPAKGYEDIEEAKKDMTNFFIRYNRVRPHDCNNYLPPIALEQQAA
ncbi:integrase core domain-containing protein [Pseudomonas sp. TWI929]|uniref:integrase core domain-containing protein n=1 Tax=Pseudomonas sp. TWI929 TaxID=3136795 RepID=UPI00320983A2